MKQKELIEKLESLEKEINSLKEKKQNKIHYLLLQIMEKYTKKQIFVFSIVFLFLLTLFAYAGTVTKTNTFSTGEVVSASKINANFDTLYTLVNGNLDDNNISSLSSSKITGVLGISSIPKLPDIFFPDGFGGTTKTISLESGNNYTYVVPDNKTFYLMSQSLQFGSLWFNNYEYVNCGMGTVIVKAGTTISGGTVQKFITGFEVTEGVQVVNEVLDNGVNDFTVPAGKTLYILSLSKAEGDERSALYIDSKKLIMQNEYGSWCFSHPVIVSEGLTIKASSAGYKAAITGYLK
jgi:hypothetical protein